jgi:hypothetical protein
MSYPLPISFMNTCSSSVTRSPYLEAKLAGSAMRGARVPGCRVGNECCALFWAQAVGLGGDRVFPVQGHRLLSRRYVTASHRQDRERGPTSRHAEWFAAEKARGNLIPAASSYSAPLRSLPRPYAYRAYHPLKPSRPIGPPAGLRMSEAGRGHAYSSSVRSTVTPRAVDVGERHPCPLHGDLIEWFPARRYATQTSSFSASSRAKKPSFP